ncbi:MAG: nucleotidyl transferase AbiEii/AbiGii toxin family protein [Candidatus Dormibacteria bacterium]
MPEPDPEQVLRLAARDPKFVEVLEAAARAERLVPGAVVVGETAATLWAGHRVSYDADHVISDLSDRFEMVLEALEQDQGWATNRLMPGKVILGNLDGVEVGVRQMRRRRPLEVVDLQLPSGASLRVPTIEETLRIKAFLVIRRNQTRDYLDVAALAETMGIERAAEVLAGIDDYYADQAESRDGVASQVVRQLGDPRPADRSVTKQLSRYKRLQPRWSRWQDVVAVTRAVAVAMTRTG